MFSIKNEILKTTKDLNINISEVSHKQTNVLINSIVDKYANSKKKDSIWEGFTEEFSIHNRDAWKWIDKILKDKQNIMFFNPNEESVAFEFCSRKDIVTILYNTYGFEFYLTNKTVDYVMCFNHHDYLVVCGKAIEWLKEYLSKPGRLQKAMKMDNIMAYKAMIKFLEKYYNLTKSDDIASLLGNDFCWRQ